MQALLGTVVVLVLSWSAPAGAVIIASGDGTGNTSAPPDDPGFAHVATRSYASSVYIGDGWVLTADHVPTGDVLIEGVLYRWVTGSEETVDPADLKLFRIESDPGLPLLPIAADPPAGEIVLIGIGRNRGVPIYDWDGSPDLDGWHWGTGRATRWGTNDVKDVSVQSPAGSGIFFFTVDFSASGGTEDECQVAAGDSGGPVFSKSGGTWELTGIQVTRTLYGGQATDTALFGNESWSVQLSPYRSQILGILAQPVACENGVDDDGDGLVDYPDDPGCLDLDDAFERADHLPCDDGIDNDGDGLTDYPDDPGCNDADDLSEEPNCSDGIDNDGDGLIDHPNDRGCADALDLSERNPTLICDDGVDNDGDALVDYPDDPGCYNTLWVSENPQCMDGIDNDGDGLIDHPDDPACVSAFWFIETSQCQDGVDNDDDGLMDFDGGASAGVRPTWRTDPDPQCVGRPGGLNEGCGLGAELALLLPLLTWLWRRRSLHRV